MAIRNGVGEAPVVDTVPASDDLGQIVRPIGPMDVNVLSGGGTPRQPSESSIVDIPASVISVVIAAANLTRLGLSIYNDSDGTLYLRTGIGATTTANWSVRLEKDEFYELPSPVFTGVINGIWSSVSGNGARVTEFTEP